MCIIIIGSGIAGLSTAIALRRVGIEATVYERAPELREVGAGISLWANAMRALDALGVGDAVRRVSLSLVQSEMRSRNGHRILIRTDAVELNRKQGWKDLVRMVHRADLVQALASHPPALDAHYGFECTNVVEDGGHVTVKFANGHIDSADAVIGADGLHSVVRARMLGEEPPRYAGYTCWRGVAPRSAAIEPGYVGEWWGRGRRFGITTLPGDRVYWFAVRNAPANAEFQEARGCLLEMFAEFAEPVPALIAATPADKIIRSDILDRPPARPWGKGRIVLVGDAAHPTTPNFGQGGCMAIEDAVVLARNLVEHANEPAAAFSAFESERFPRTSRVVNESWKFGRMAQIENGVLRFLRDSVLCVAMPLLGPGKLLEFPRFDVGSLPTVN